MTAGPTTAASAPSGVASLAITHEHGVDTSTHASRAGAEAALLAYVVHWWPYEAPECVPVPEEATEAVEAYFMEHASQEDYEITTP